MNTGDKCPKCDTGHMIAINSFIRGEYRIRYLACGACGHRPPNNKVIIPKVFAPFRGIRRKRKSDK